MWEIWYLFTCVTFPESHTHGRRSSVVFDISTVRKALVAGHFVSLLEHGSCTLDISGGFSLSMVDFCGFILGRKWKTFGQSQLNFNQMYEGSYHSTSRKIRHIAARISDAYFGHFRMYNRYTFVSITSICTGIQLP